MKIIKFSSIVIEGFRSIVHPVTVDLDKPGLNLIKGINGAGKTTIFDALVWCLYGDNLKETTNAKIPTWKELRDDSWSGTCVGLKFSINDEKYMVIRTIDWTQPSRVGKNGFIVLKQVNKEWADITTGPHQKDVQSTVNDLLGLDSKAFMNSILFGQRLTKLVESDNSDKRELFSKLFEMTFIINSKEEATIEKNKKETELFELKSSINGAKITVDNLSDEIIRGELILSDFKKGQQDRKTSLQARLNEIKGDIEELQAQKKSHKDIVKVWNQTEYDEKDQSYNQLVDEFNEKKKKLDDATANAENANSLREQSMVWVNDLMKQIASVKKSQEEFGLIRAERISTLKDKLQLLIQDQTLRLNAIDTNCPTCGQKLPAIQIKQIKDDLKKEFETQGNGYKEDIEKAEKEQMPKHLDINDLNISFDKATKNREKAQLDYNKFASLQQQLEEEIKPLSDKVDAAYEEMEILDKNHEKYKVAKQHLDSFNIDIDKLEIQEKGLQTQLEALSEEKDPNIDIISLRDNRAKAEAQVQYLTAKTDILEKDIELLSWWIKIGFAAGGLPAYIFKAMLDQLNENVKKYADRLGVSVEFSVDLTKASKPFTTICSIGNKIDKDYKEFSGGQKQRLDIVLIFAMHDLISYNSNINLLIMDEVFEGLDEAGEAAVFDLIRMKVDEGKAIYVITHSPHIDSLYSSTIEIEADPEGRTIIQL